MKNATQRLHGNSIALKQRQHAISLATQLSRGNATDCCTESIFIIKKGDLALSYAFTGLIDGYSRWGFTNQLGSLSRVLNTNNLDVT